MSEPTDDRTDRAGHGLSRVAAAARRHALPAARRLPVRPAVPVLLDGDHDVQAGRGAARLRAGQSRSGSITRRSRTSRSCCSRRAYPDWLWNTMLVSVVVDVRFRSFAACCAAYAIERLRFPGARYVGLAHLPRLSRAAVASCSSRSPRSSSSSASSTRDWALILTYPTFLIPFCTWLLMGYFRSIPYELEECALIDGATRLQILCEDHPAARGARPDLGRHLRLHAVVERVHLRADLHLVVGDQDGAGRRRHRAGRGRRLPLGRR